MVMIEAYKRLSEVTKYPLHLWVTKARPPATGTIMATAGIGTLLA